MRHVPNIVTSLKFDNGARGVIEFSKVNIHYAILEMFQKTGLDGSDEFVPQWRPLASKHHMTDFLLLESANIFRKVEYVDDTSIDALNNAPQKTFLQFPAAIEKEKEKKKSTAISRRKISPQRGISG